MTAEAKNAHVWLRDKHDWYVEPTAATEALLKVEAFIGTVWDPACGQGNVIAAFEGRNPLMGSDIVQRTAARWFAGPSDFLALDPQNMAARVENIVTNPPFFRGQGTDAFIRKALEIATAKVAVFTDIRFLAGGGRARGLYRECPPDRIWIVTPRVSCPPGSYLAAGGKASGGSADWCWLVWDRTAPHSDTRLGWLHG